MKDTFASSAEDSLAARSDLMVPAQGSFTRPRRFVTRDESEVSDADLVIDTDAHAPPARYADGAGLPATAPRDLWGVLHEQLPGTDQHILAGSQAAEDFRATDVSRAFDLLRTRLRQTAGSISVWQRPPQGAARPSQQQTSRRACHACPPRALC